MPRSSLLGAERAPAIPAGRDVGSLGPSDSSDSGSDTMGIEDRGEGDLGLPTDVALGEDREFPGEHPGSRGGDSDAAGTGERASASNERHGADGADIGLDRVIGEPGGSGDGALDPDALIADEFEVDDDEAGDDGKAGDR